MGDMEDPDNNTDPEIIPVDFKTVTAGEPVFLGDYTLSVGDRILYDVPVCQIYRPVPEH